MRGVWEICGDFDHAGYGRKDKDQYGDVCGEGKGCLPEPTKSPVPSVPPRAIICAWLRSSSMVVDRGALAPTCVVHTAGRIVDILLTAHNCRLFLLRHVNTVFATTARSWSLDFLEKSYQRLS
jgi:hypothetical protein